MKIVVFDAKPYDIEFFEKWNKIYGAQITYFEEKLSLKNVMLTKYQDVVCTFVNDDLNEKVINILSKNGVRAIAVRAAGYNNIDMKAARENRVTVFRVPAYSPFAVAEHALALLMTVNRKTHKAYNRTREGNFSLAGLTGMDLHGKTAGIIGTGKIARIFIKILNGLGMKVIAYDKFPNEQAAKEENFTYMTKDEVFANADVISLHCPLFPETRHTINEESIAKMKDGVIIINSARGGLVDTEALINGLKDKKIGGAGLDVYENERDYFFEDESASVLEDDTLARLLSFNNVVLTSHQAFLTNEALNNTQDVYINGDEVDIPAEYSGNTKYVMVPFVFKANNNAPYVTISTRGSTGPTTVVYYDKLPNSILTKEDLIVPFIPYASIQFNNKTVYLNSAYPLSLQHCKPITDVQSKEYISLLDLFNSDNAFGKFLRNVTGFFVIDQRTILFAYPETYGQFARYLIQEKILK